MAKGASIFYAYQQTQNPTSNKMRKYLDTWTENLKNGSVSDIVSLYSTEAILLATYSQKIRIGHNSIADYFINLKEKKGLGCELLSFYPQPSKSIVSGEYRFFWEDGEAFARYTFVFDKSLILNHHSSEIPK